MRQALKTHKRKLQYVAPVFIVGALSFAVLGFGGNPNNPGNNEPFITDLEPFVLVAENSIHLSGSTQTSSGDIASNKRIHIAENGIINGNLFSDRIQLADNVSINGNITYNKLIKAQSAEIFGEQTNSIQKNIVELPQVPNFQTGTLSHVVEEDTTLNPGNYDSIEVKEGATLTLTPGTYNLNKLILKDNSKLLYSDQITINIKDKLKIQSNTLVASSSATSISTTDLQVNYTGKPPIIIGDSSFIISRILSPNSRIQIGNNTTYLGQILAKDINVGEEGVLSRGLTFTKTARPEDIVTDPDGGIYPVNILLVFLEPNTTFVDAQKVAEEMSGTIAGTVNSINLYQIELQTETIEELETVMDTIRARTDLKIEGVSRDFFGPFQ